MFQLDGMELHYRKLNEQVKLLAQKIENIQIDNVSGQPYIGAGLTGKLQLVINGVPGNNLGVFMDGPEIFVHDNAQDLIGNTMNEGKIVVHGHCGDVMGYGMRGGEIYIRDRAGYRAGIHMKGYGEKFPVIVIGGTVGDFTGEYMAGGVIIVLGLNSEEPLVGDYLAVGMHGGAIYLRGEIDEETLAPGVGILPMDEKDLFLLRRHVKEYCAHFGENMDHIMAKKFTKIGSLSHRPYKRLYSY